MLARREPRAGVERSVILGQMRFVAGWRVKPLNQPLVSLGLILFAYVSSYLQLLFMFFSVVSGLDWDLGLVCYPAKRLVGKTRFCTSHVTGTVVCENTYNVLSGTLNPTITYLRHKCKKRFYIFIIFVTLCFTLFHFPNV